LRSLNFFQTSNSIAVKRKNPEIANCDAIPLKEIKIAAPTER
jgi:hypothetical protein